MPSGRPKGGTNKYCTLEEKEKTVLYHIKNEIGMDKCAKKNFVFLERKCLIGFLHIEIKKYKV